MGHSESMVPGLISEIMGIIDDLSSDFVEGCAAVPVGVSALDFIALRDAAFEVTDIKGLIESEKNFLGEVFRAATNDLSLPGLESAIGGLGGNPSSPESTDGGQQTSDKSQPQMS